MKLKAAKQAGSILMAALLSVSGIAGTSMFVFAEEETEEVAEAGTESAAEEANDSQEAAEIAVTEFTLTLDEETTLTVSNVTGITLESVSLEDGSAAGSTDEEDAADDDAAEGETESDDAQSADGSDEAASLLLVTEDGTTHTFTVADTTVLAGLSDLTLSEKIGFLFLSGTDAGGEEKYYYETADEITLDESVTMYTTGQVTVRESADGSSTAVGYADRGSAVEVLGGTSSWFLISQDDLTGYVAARFLTTDEAEAQSAVEEEENARAAIAAAAAAAAAAQSSSSGSQSGSSSSDDACLTGGVLN